MAVTIGSARHDERGKYAGGKPGDQDGTEVSTQDFYWHPKGWRVFRSKDPQIAVRQSAAMQAACSNNHIGYCQTHRTALWATAKLLNFNLADVKTDTETDCSDLVRCCMAYAGVKVQEFTTANEPSVILSTGMYKEVEITNAAELVEGDILVTKTKGHTAIVVKGKTVSTLPVKLGWVQSGDAWYYRISQGQNAHGFKDIKNADGHTRRYYFDNTGKMLTAWHLIEKNWYYFQPSGDFAGAMYRSDDAGAQAIWVIK